MTSKLKCPFCEYELQENRTTNLCCPICGLVAPTKLWQALTQAKQDLEQSEKCCSAWETQALDYKAETIALSGKLEIAKKALTDAKQTLFYCWDTYDIHSAKCTAEDVDKALEQIRHKEQK